MVKISKKPNHKYVSLPKESLTGVSETSVPLLHLLQTLFGHFRSGTLLWSLAVARQELLSSSAQCCDVTHCGAGSARVIKKNTQTYIIRVQYFESSRKSFRNRPEPPVFAPFWPDLDLLRVYILHFLFVCLSVSLFVCLFVEPLISDHRQKLERLKP